MDQEQTRQQHRLAFRAEELPVALYDAGTSLALKPAPGEAPGTVRDLQMSIPPEQFARLEMPLGGKVQLSGLRGGIEIDGKQLFVDARGLQCDLEIVAEGATVVASATTGSVRLRGREIQATLQGTTGSVSADVVGGTLKILGGSGIDLATDGTTVEIQQVKERASVRATGGSVRVSGFEGTGEFQLTGSSLAIEKSKGDVTVTSDGDVVYKEMEAALHFDIYGGSVRGEGNKGLVEAPDVRSCSRRKTADRPSGLSDSSYWKRRCRGTGARSRCPFVSTHR